MIIWFWLCFILQLTLNCNVVDGPTLLFHQQYRVYHFYSSGWFLHRKGTDCIKNHRFSNYYHCNANEYEASRKWRVNIDRYGSCFYRMPATFRLSWRIDREGTGGRRWTEVPLFWGWPTSWSPKRIYHTMTTLCCLLSKLTSNTFILTLWANEDFIPNFLQCTYWLWTYKRRNYFHTYFDYHKQG